MTLAEAQDYIRQYNKQGLDIDCSDMTDNQVIDFAEDSSALGEYLADQLAEIQAEEN